LPFALRADMLRAALADLEANGPLPCPFAVNEVENERPGLSYTIDTLKVLAGRFPEARLTFAVGCDDFCQIIHWRRGREIPDTADLAVLPRAGCGLSAFLAALPRLRPDALPLEREEDGPPELECSYALPGGGKIMYISIPALDLSSSLTRRRFLTGRNAGLLVPPGVCSLLRKNEAYIKKIWEE
jgi:nicotinate-nucleotide adenylyltransferase